MAKQKPEKGRPKRRAAPYLKSQDAAYDRVRMLLDEKGLSQVDLAEHLRRRLGRASYSRAAVGSNLKERRGFGDKWDLIAEFLGVPIEELLGATRSVTPTREAERAQTRSASPYDSLERYLVTSASAGDVAREGQYVLLVPVDWPFFSGEIGLVDTVAGDTYLRRVFDDGRSYILSSADGTGVEPVMLPKDDVQSIRAVAMVELIPAEKFAGVVSRARDL